MSSEAISLWTETSSDPELIAGVRAGDTAAFGVLYERHVDAARKVASMYSNSPTDVEDVVSEAFSRVLRALQRGRSEEHTSELQSRDMLVCRLLLEKKKM